MLIGCMGLFSLWCERQSPVLDFLWTFFLLWIYGRFTGIGNRMGSDQVLEFHLDSVGQGWVQQFCLLQAEVVCGGWSLCLIWVQRLVHAFIICFVKRVSETLNAWSSALWTLVVVGCHRLGGSWRMALDLGSSFTDPACGVGNALLLAHESNPQCRVPTRWSLCGCRLWQLFLLVASLCRVGEASVPGPADNFRIGTCNPGGLRS